MTRRNRSPETADLFTVGASTPRKGDSSGQHPATTSAALLPTDLEGSLAILNDSEFDRLLAGVIGEASRRHKRVQFPLDPNAPAASVKATQKPKPEGVTAAKANLVRAAFKAGVKPGAISRQFGLSQATIRQVLRSEET